MANDTISIQAEALFNIRQASLTVSLPSPARETSTVSTSTDGCVIYVNHNNAKQFLEAPVPLVPIKKPVQVVRDATEFSFRFALAKSSRPASSAVFRAEDQPVPWTAVDLVPGTTVTCRACGGVVVARDALAEWKDLPSENWAEMMEFWHCHKPVAHGNDDGSGGGGGGSSDNGGGDSGGGDNAATTKAYGANSAITSQSGVGFIDLTTLMLHDSDCQNLEYETPASSDELDVGPSQHAGPGTRPVLCAACRREVGFAAGPGAVRLYKWQVGCSTRGPWAPPRVTELLSAALLATVSRSGATKSLVMSRHAPPGGGTDPVLHLWILNNNVVHCSTARRTRETALKVAFTVITRESADSMLGSMTGDAQEVNLPHDAVAQVVAELEAIYATLPLESRDFRGFRLSFLRRWMAGG